ncbi:hypothetical protein D3C72_2535360 [compost metagenome]
MVDKWAFTAHPERQERGLGTVTIVVLSLFGLLMAAIVVLMIVAISMGASSGFNH